MSSTGLLGKTVRHYWSDIFRSLLALPDVQRAVIGAKSLPRRDLSRPPRGVITPPPSFHATPPNHLKFKGGYQGGVYGGGGVYVIVMEWVINVVKY